MLKIGITGGIGSGKTTVCKVFEVLGIPAFNADEVAKDIMLNDEELVKNIKKHFGADAYFKDGALNRKYLANIVFNDENELENLNKLVHPATIQAFERWAKKQSSPYCLHEAAILFESGAYKTCDHSILVSASTDTRIKRVMKRDQVSEKEVMDRIKMQMPESEKAELADFIIFNEDDTALIPQVLKLHQTFLKLT